MEESFIKRYCGESDCLNVVFGGISHGLGIAPFEFFKLLEDEVGANILFIRDLSQAWYQNGLPGHGDSHTDIANFIRR